MVRVEETRPLETSGGSPPYATAAVSNRSFTSLGARGVIVSGQSERQLVVIFRREGVKQDRLGHIKSWEMMLGPGTKLANYCLPAPPLSAGVSTWSQEACALRR
jgi:hypothetical protein